jgi:hypothetical protein
MTLFDMGLSIICLPVTSAYLGWHSGNPNLFLLTYAIILSTNNATQLWRFCQSTQENIPFTSRIIGCYNIMCSLIYRFVNLTKKQD